MKPAMNPDLGHVLLFTGGDPIAALVKWQSRSEYSHAALLLPGGARVIESYPFYGVRSRELTAKDWEKVHAYAVPGMTGEQWCVAVAFAEAQLGNGYDWRNVLRFVSRLPATENNRWFCSELVFADLEYSYRKVLEMEAEYVDPGHLPTSPLLRRDVQFERLMAEALAAEDGED
jgi:hypothetical protein